MTTTKEAGAQYWGRLIEPDKSAALLFQQLLLGIANYITKDVAPWHLQCLTPDKLAAFYRLVGGNYDPLFLETPHATLSFIYQSLGCFHTLQPTTDPFASPSLPALTPQGFVRWQTIQLLLGPEEHVPFLQQALKRFEIINPAVGDVFPKVLPREAFPLVPDEEMTRWHEGVCKMLKQEADSEQAKPVSDPDSHSRPGGPHDRSRKSMIEGRVAVDDIPDYFSNMPRRNHEGRPEFARVFPASRQPYHWPAQDHKEDHRGHHSRPRSFTDHPHRQNPYWFSHRSNDPESSQRHEHRHRRARSPSTASVTSDSEASDEEGITPRKVHHRPVSYHHDTDRLFPPSAYRDRRHSHHTIHNPHEYDPPQQSRYVPHGSPSYFQPSQAQPKPPQGDARGLNVRSRNVESGLGYTGSAPSTPGVYPARAPAKFVESGRNPREERPVIRRFVSPLKGVGGRRYPTDTTAGC
ncbi:MAG: hypothetical protein M1830_001844 [Pleopsidium flavum]|nr:MAG: hypothetical protein M1830_001844 [Pleopsidium flavum]